MLQKMTVQSKGPRLATRVFHKTYFPKPSINYVPQKKQLQQVSLQAGEKLKKQRLNELSAEVNFSIQNMVSHQLKVAKFQAEISFFKAGNISNQINNWESVTNDKFIPNIVKNNV